MSAYISKGKIILAAGLIGLLLLAGCGGGGGGGGSTGSVTVTLNDQLSGPIASATVLLQQYSGGSYTTRYSGSTDLSGQVNFPAVTTGDYRAAYTSPEGYLFTAPEAGYVQTVTINGSNVFPILVPTGPPYPPTIP